MDNQKQIEEITDCLIGRVVTGADSTKVLRLGYITVREIASILVEECYRKIRKNEVVLSREEYEKLQALKNDYVKGYEAGVDEGWDNARKETAEKFAERLKESLEENSPIAGYDLEDLEFDGETIQECIDEIVKEFTEGE